MSAFEVVRMVSGDNRPLFSCTSPGAVLTGYTISGRLKRSDNTLIERPGVITDEMGGTFTVEFQSSDIIPGRHSLEFLLVAPDGSRRTEPADAPVTVLVRESLTPGDVSMSGPYTLTDLTVTNPIVGSVTGHAGSAGSLSPGRTINGTLFDGTTDISISVTGSSVLASVLTGYTSGAGTVSSADSLLQAFEKLDGNIALKRDIATAIDHTTLTSIGTNTHAQIDTAIAAAAAHEGDATIHRSINDAGAGATDLWSASKITTALAAKRDAGTIDHTTLTSIGANTHAQIDTALTASTAHIADATIHRSINDAGAAVTDLWSASKITSSLATKANDAAVAHLTGAETIAGVKTFSSIIAGSVNGNAATVTTNANLTGDVTSSGNATTLTNAPVIAKVLTGYVSGAGTVAATDSILAAVQKLNGNTTLKATDSAVVHNTGTETIAGTKTFSSTIVGSVNGNAATVTTNANLTGDVTSSGNATTLSNAAVIAKVLTGFSAAAGTVSSADSILAAFEKVVGNIAAIGGSPPSLPTVQQFLTGSGTYTTPANVKYVIVEAVGGGGGGGGSGSGVGPAGAGGAGGDTTFGSSLILAGGGGGGGATGGGSGPGGSASAGAATPIAVLSGAQGGPNVAPPGVPVALGIPASSPFGGAGMGGDAVPNSGSGGAGTFAGGYDGGGGGSAGGYVKAQIFPTPGQTFAYQVGDGGAAGSAGSSGVSGFNGGSGVITVMEYYA